MTSKERIIAALHNRPLDHIPFSPFIVYLWDHLPETVRTKGELAFYKDIGADPLWRGAPCPFKAVVPGLETRQSVEDEKIVTVMATPVGTLKMAHLKSDGANTLFLVEHPLKKEEDYKIQMWIEEHTRFEPDEKAVTDHFNANGREGLSLALLSPRMKSAFQSLIEHLSGTEELMYALADFPDTVHALLEVMVRKNLEAARLAAQSGTYEYFITWEDSSTQNYSPDQYRKYIAPEITQWCKLLKACGKHYIQHACGHVRHLLPIIREQGLLAVESLSSPPTGNLPAQEARRILGNGIGIIGGIEPTHFLNLEGRVFEEYVERIISECKGGPFILSNADSCPPGVAIEKFRRISEIVTHHPYN